MNEPLNPTVQKALDLRKDLEERKIRQNTGLWDHAEILRLAVQRTRNWAVTQNFSISQIDAWTDVVMPGYIVRNDSLDMPDFAELHSPAASPLSEEGLEYAAMLAEAGGVAMRYDNLAFESWRRFADTTNRELCRRIGWVGDRAMGFADLKGTYFEIDDSEIRLMVNRNVFGTVRPDREDGVELSGFSGWSKGAEKESCVAFVLHDSNVSYLKDMTHGFENHVVMEFGTRKIVCDDMDDANFRSAMLSVLREAEFTGSAELTKICGAYMQKFTKEGPVAAPVMKRSVWSYSGQNVARWDDILGTLPGKEMVAKKQFASDMLSAVVKDVRTELNTLADAPSVTGVFNYRGALWPREDFRGRCDLGCVKGKDYAVYGQYAPGGLGRVNFYTMENGERICRNSFTNSEELREHMAARILSKENVAAAAKSVKNWQARREQPEGAKPAKKSGHGRHL